MPITYSEKELDAKEKQRLIKNGSMDDVDDSYPRICEGCDSEYPGNAYKAMECGWRLSPDGWLCNICSSESADMKQH